MFPPLWVFIYLIIPIAILAVYYWIALDEMRNQHRVRRTVWLVIVPTCIFLIPVTYFLSIIPMVAFIALGEVYDRPKPEKIERIEQARPDRWQKFVLVVIVCAFLLFMLFPPLRHLFYSID